jgi:hypothetical protein
LQIRISWYEIDVDGNERLIQSDAQKYITVDLLAEQSFSEIQEEIFGISQTLNRLCLDPYVLREHHTHRFKCRAESVCNSNKDESGVISVRRNRHHSNAKHASQLQQAPLITTITTIRLEFVGPLVQLFCNASGYPRPTIEWFLMDELDENKLYSITDHSFIRVSIWLFCYNILIIHLFRY